MSSKIILHGPCGLVALRPLTCRFSHKESKPMSLASILVPQKIQFAYLNFKFATRIMLQLDHILDAAWVILAFASKVHKTAHADTSKNEYN